MNALAPSQERPLAVIGAGVAGLALAYDLLRRGTGPVVVYEQAERVGGLAATFEWEGFHLDYGPHRLLSHYDEVSALTKDLIGDELVYTQRHSAIRLARGFAPFPGSPAAVARAMGLGRGATAFASYLAAKARPGNAPARSYEDYIVRQFGRGLYRAVFETFPLKVWGLPGHEMDQDAAKIRLASKGLWESLRDMFLRGGKTYVARVAYPARGVGRLAQRLAEEVARLGGEVRTGCRVTGIDLLGGRIDSLEITDNNGGRCVQPVAALASTMPLAPMAALLAGGPQGEAPARALTTATQGLQTQPVCLVYVLLRKPRLSPYHWLYFPGRDVFFTRIYEPKAFSPDEGPADRTVVCVECSCFRDWVGEPLGQDEIKERVVQGLEACGLATREEIADMRILRVEEAYPVLRAGYGATLGRALAALGAIENGYCLGRQGLFSYNNTDLSIKMGLDLAGMMHAGTDPKEWYRHAAAAYGSYRIVD